MKRWILLFLAFLGFGAIKVQIESNLLHHQKSEGFQLARLNLDLRGQLSQNSFVAALSGFRAVIADILWIQSLEVANREEWGRLKLMMDSATQLQPKSVIFWNMAHQRMALDASIAERLNEKKQPNEFLRRKVEREYQQLGERYLLDGIEFNPDSALLYERLGDLYSRKFYDHSKAAEAYAEACKRPGAMQYLRRSVVYEIEKVPGREKEAYQKLKALYDEGPQQHLPTVLILLNKLQRKLDIPKDQWIPETYIPRNSTPKIQP